jgi:hypothetical protein
MPLDALHEAHQALARARLLVAEAGRRLDEATAFTCAAEARAERLRVDALTAGDRTARLRRHQSS